MPTWPWFVLTMLYGACVGSFLNVVMHRLPEGLSLWRPPSRCPRCEHKLAWYDNVPIFGWIWLGGRCRYCKTSISLQYPVVEAVACALFTAMFAICYLSAPLYRPAWSPAMGGLDANQTWPMFVLYLVLIGALIAASGIDAKLFIIPRSIPWLITVIALIGLPVASVWLPGLASAVGPYRETVAPTAQGAGAGLAFGGVAGLILAVILLQLGWLPLSFADLDDQTGALGEPDKRQKKASANPANRSTVRQLQAVLVMLILIVLSLALGGAAGWVIALLIGWWGLFLYKYDAPAPGNAPGSSHSAEHESDKQASDQSPQDWLAYPHARREMFKELLFLAFPLVAMVLGVKFLSPIFAAVEGGAVAAPIRIAAGVLLGYLVGAGVVWGIRILGTLVFGKEAMGLGDVHLLAAIGAVMGPTDAVLVFFLAPFLALTHTAVLVGLGPIFRRRFAAIPYGPHLCGAALLLLLFREPVYERLSLRLHLEVIATLLADFGII